MFTVFSPFLCAALVSCPGLSKWVRQRISHQREFEQALHSLRAFIDHRMKVDQETVDIDSSTLSVW